MSSSETISDDPAVLFRVRIPSRPRGSPCQSGVGASINICTYRTPYVRTGFQCLIDGFNHSIQNNYNNQNLLQLVSGRNRRLVMNSKQDT